LTWRALASRRHCITERLVVIFNIQILQDNVLTQLRCDEDINNGYTQNVLKNLPVTLF